MLHSYMIHCKGTERKTKLQNHSVTYKGPKKINPTTTTTTRPT